MLRWLKRLVHKVIWAFYSALVGSLVLGVPLLIKLGLLHKIAYGLEIIALPLLYICLERYTRGPNES